MTMEASFLAVLLCGLVTGPSSKMSFPLHESLHDSLLSSALITGWSHGKMTSHFLSFPCTPAGRSAGHAALRRSEAENSHRPGSVEEPRHIAPG